MPADRRNLRLLRAIVFTVGVSTLGAEIAAARLMAPFFGASTIVWANTIATVLVALSIGYWLGGRLADRRPHLAGLARWVLVASVLLALVPIVADPFLDLSVEAFDDIDVGAALGSLVGVLALVAVPVLLLGAVSPWAIRLSVDRVEDAGRTAGSLYALSTIGSLIGTFGATLLLIPLVGTQRTFLILAALVAFVAALALPRTHLLVPAAIVGLIALPTGTTKPIEGARVLEERETEQQYARVVELEDGERRLELNEGQAFHSVWRPRSVLTGNVWDGYLSTPISVLGRPPRSMAILGNGAGTTMRAYEKFFPETEIDGVEIDGELTELGEKWFGLRERPNARLHTDDARPFLRAAERRWEAILVDAYRQPYIPFYLTTREFFRLTRERLEPGGVLVVNAGHPEGSTKLEQMLSAGLRDSYAHVMREPITEFNTLLIAADTPPSAEALRAAMPDVDPGVRPVLAASAARLAPSLPGGTVYTDDKAPVEWLIDRSIVAYAAGEE
ncbi:MAG TPA: fused MFS/spermidine synthase [Solirubrobacteraceae bacterium]|nr:fused MFS/spermidine synthase [Solirubrobacteraceae bacterium]